MRRLVPLTASASHYEEHCLVRTVGDLIRRPEVALGELVANAWDTGASRVDVNGEATRVPADDVRSS